MMNNNVIVLIFLYTLDRLSDLDKLCSNNLNFDISLITNKLHAKNLNLINFIEKHKNRIFYFGYHNNYGVDIAPFLEQILMLDSARYPYFIKLHSKQSTLGALQQVDWGSILWDSFIGNNTIFQQNLQIVKQNHVGILTNPALIYIDRELNNKNKIKILTEYLDINYNLVKNTKFAAGSMFMGKTKIFQNILNPTKIKYIKTLLSTEVGKVDDRDYENGTFSHSMERIFGYLVTAQNLCIHSSSLFPIIKLYNRKYKKLNLHITYNNIAYLIEDINICGKVFNYDNNFLDIQWYHIQDKIIQYKFINSKHIINTIEVASQE